MTNDGGFACLETRGENVADTAKRTFQPSSATPAINIQMMLTKKKSFTGSSENDQNNSTMLIPTLHNSQFTLKPDADKPYDEIESVQLQQEPPEEVMVK